METLKWIIISLFIFCGAVIIIKVFSAPLRFLIKLLINTFLGFFILIVINFIGAKTGIVPGVNFINAAVVGVFGFPGVILLILLKWLFLT